MNTAALPGPPRIALTGGIASGKSIVADVFARLGVPVIDSDVIAREVVGPGTPLRAALFERFGASIRTATGDLDRAALRRIVFADARRRQELESLLHPAIRLRAEQLAADAGGPYQIHVVPLLVETGGTARYSRVLLVDCPESLQISRLRARTPMSEEEARAILGAQASRAQRRAAADDIICNDGPPEALAAQVAALHEQYRALRGTPHK